MIVSTNDWNAILNSVLPNVQDVEVKQESDTSGLSMLHNSFINYLSNKQARRDMPYQIKVGLCVRQAKNGEVKYYFTHIGFSEYLRNQKVSFDYSMLREMLLKFGAVEDVLDYTNSFGEEVHFPCWSKKEDKNIEDSYSSAMEVEQGDKNSLSLNGVGEASNIDEYEPKEEEKLYSEEDKKDAEGLI
jgi:hypothetical protein